MPAMPDATPTQLKLAAEDAEDLAILSAHVQDAVLRVGDLAWLPKSRRFACVLNRFRWEAGRPGGRGERVRAGLHFDGVLSVKASRIRQDAKDAVLCLLAATFTPGEEGAGVVTLAFAGGGQIRLYVECLDAHLADVSAAWTARATPEHALD